MKKLKTASLTLVPFRKHGIEAMFRNWTYDERVVENIADLRIRILQKWNSIC